MVNNKKGFVCYGSVLRQFNRLAEVSHEEAFRYIKAIMEYGILGKEPEADDTVWLYGLEGDFASIGSAKDRYEQAVENGKKGGRPKTAISIEEIEEKYAELGTWNKVAKFFNVSEDTIRKIRRMSEYEKLKNPKNGGFSDFLDNSSIESEKPKKGGFLGEKKVFSSGEEPEKPKNLNDNKNVNDNGIFSDFLLTQKDPQNPGDFFIEKVNGTYVVKETGEIVNCVVNCSEERKERCQYMGKIEDSDNKVYYDKEKGEYFYTYSF